MTYAKVESTSTRLRDNRRPVSGAKPRRDPLVGASIDGRYQVTERIGAGGMAVVYGATQLNVDRPVAIKVLGSGSAADDEVVQRFQNEARVIARLRHPNVLKLHDVGTLEDGRLYIVTELLHGAPLDRLVHDRALTPQQVVRLMQPVAEALAEAHNAGVIHRDLKPANLYLERAGDVELIKVLDFGIAKLGGQVRVTASGSIFGTPRYMSPEQAEARELDGRSDIYSLGVVLFECFCGRAPFEGDSPAKLLIQHVSELPPPLAELSPQPLPPALEALVEEMLAKDRADRPPTMLAVRDRLRAIDDELRRNGMPTPPRALTPSEGSTPVPLLEAPETTVDARWGAPAPARSPARRRLPWVPMGVAAAGFLALIGVIAVGERKPALTPVPVVAPTPTLAPMPTPTAVPTPTPTATPTPTPTAVPTSTPTPTPSPSATPAPTARASASPTPSPKRRAPAKSAAPVPDGFQDVDYRELGTP